jgi:hypothetical protein
LVVISEAETTLKVAAVPLKLTELVVVRFVPRMMTLSPALPDAGKVSTKGPNPIFSLKIEPGAPLAFVPYKFPSVVWKRLPACPVLLKEWRTVSTPSGVIWKTVPRLSLPPVSVVP